MDISKARMVFELTKNNKKVLVTLWDEDKISSCVEEAETQRCEACKGDEELCREYIKHLVDSGYEAKEIRLGELGDEESLPTFLAEREVKVEAEPIGEE